MEGGVVARYLLDGPTMLEELDAGGATTTTYFANPQAIDEMLSFTTGGVTYYPLTDALGSIYAVADASGKVTRTYWYYPYGERTTKGTGPDIPFGFTGREHDLGPLNYHRDRYMAPRLGAWLQPDRLNYGFEKSRGRQAEPLGPLAKVVGYGGDRSYTYVENRPTTATDPSGMETLAGLAPWPGYNVEWWSLETPEGEELYGIWSEIVVSRHWEFAISYSRIFGSGCFGHSSDLLRAIRQKGLRFFTPSQVVLSLVPGAVHSVILLTPIPPTRFGRVIADSYLWPGMSDFDPEDSRWVASEE